MRQLSLFPALPRKVAILTPTQLKQEVKAFQEFGKPTLIVPFPDTSLDLDLYVNEYWTSKQRVAHSLHEISYRACFKPQLPRFFIDRLSVSQSVVYDPFMGRGTTLIEAALRGRIPFGADVNPLSRILIAPRLHPPTLTEIRDRLAQIDLSSETDIWDDLHVFFHPTTLREISSLRSYIMAKESVNELDYVDMWIRMVATNRLTGHSQGFLSVYTLPPNQTVSVESQRKINEKRSQTPPIRDLREVIICKSKSLLRNLTREDRSNLRRAEERSQLVTGSSDSTSHMKSASVDLVVTSPPFLDVVDYQSDNWLRCWFNGIDAATVDIWQLSDPEEWRNRMIMVFTELHRLLVPGGYIAFEVGEVRGGKLLLETLVVPAGREANLTPIMILINDQVFTKTSNCWGVKNLKKGTNTNRIVVFRKD